MLKDLVAVSARHKALVLLLALAGLIGGAWALKRAPLDALPDVSDVQVILLARWNRPPTVVEDQVAYPLVAAMLGTAQVKTVRASSDYGYSYVYVIFKEGTDLYWARSRVLESLSKVLPQLPPGVRVTLGPDASSVGWVYQYAIVDRSGKSSLADLRALQDWFLGYQLESVDGVAEAAPIGGFQKEYQVSLNPNALWSYKIPASKVFKAVADNNNETGARVVEMSGREFMLRPRGYLKGVKDLRKIAVGSDPKRGVPVLLGDVAHIAEGPALRRGVGEFDGLGEAPGGIVIVEPWLTPRDYHVGHVAFMSCGTREAPLVRMNVSDLRRGRSVMNMHHLGLVDGQVRHWVERHEMALFDRPTMRRAFRAAGLEVRYLSGAFPLDRGLYLGIRPPRSTRNALGTPRSSPLRPLRPRREVRGLPLLTRGSQPSRSGP